MPDDSNYFLITGSVHVTHDFYVWDFMLVYKQPECNDHNVIIYDAIL